MKEKLSLKSGFTIVELLIVIIVIAILALLVITTYNGVQQKADNTKSIAAAEAWTKALRLYNADTGSWPTNEPTCLGESYTTGFNGSGTGQCMNGSGYIVSSAFLTEIRPYIGNGALPTPGMQAIGDSSSWRRGIRYEVAANYNLFVVQINITTCPGIGGAVYNSAVSLAGGKLCRYMIQPAS